MRGYLGNQGRNRPNKGPRHGNRDGNRGNMVVTAADVLTR